MIEANRPRRALRKLMFTCLVFLTGAILLEFVHTGILSFILITLIEKKGVEPLAIFVGVSLALIILQFFEFLTILTRNTCLLIPFVALNIFKSTVIFGYILVSYPFEGAPIIALMTLVGTIATMHTLLCLGELFYFRQLKTVYQPRAVV